MDTVEARNLLELLAGRSTAWNALWTLLYTVAAAILGIVASGKLPSEHSLLASILMAAGFIVFAIGNYNALDAMRKQRDAVVAFVKVKAGEQRSNEILAAAEASAPPSAQALRVYHGALSAFVVALLFLIPMLLAPIK